MVDEGIHVLEVPTDAYMAVLDHTEALIAELAGPGVRDGLSADLLQLVDELLSEPNYRYRQLNWTAAKEAIAAGWPSFEVVFPRGRERLARVLLDVVERLDWLSRRGSLQTPPAPPEAIELLRYLATTLAERA